MPIFLLVLHVLHVLLPPPPKHANTLHVYNLLSHGRKMYRSMIYSTSSSFSLACLQQDDSGKAVPEIVRTASGKCDALPPVL